MSPATQAFREAQSRDMRLRHARIKIALGSIAEGGGWVPIRMLAELTGIDQTTINADCRAMAVAGIVERLAISPGETFKRKGSHVAWRLKP